MIQNEPLKALVLAAAAVDFMVGPAVDHPVNQTIMNENLGPRWDLLANATSVSPIVQVHEFFTVLGIFFPSVCGVFAGVNMSGTPGLLQFI